MTTVELVLRIQLEVPDGVTIVGAPPVAPVAAPVRVPPPVDAHEEPAAAPPTVARAPRQALGTAQRRIIEALAEHYGRIADPKGGAGSMLADLAGVERTQAAGVVRKLEDQGLLARTMNGTRRCNRIVLTAPGWLAIDRTPPAVQDTAPPALSAPAAAPPVMPDLGPIGRQPFDPDRAREQGASAAVGEVSL